MRWLACLVAFFSLCQLLTALALLVPHSDVPGQPFTSVFVMLAALGGLALARALWRRRANLGRGLALWGMGLGAWALGLTLTVASPSERREAVPALALGLAVWAVFIWAAARRLGRTSFVAAVVLMLASVVGARPTAAQEAAPESPACGRPDQTVRKLPFSAEENVDGARFVWFASCLAGMPYPFIAAKDLPSSPWFAQIDSATPAGGPRAGDVIWWPSFMATIAASDGPAVTPEGRLSLAELHRKFGASRYYRRVVPNDSGRLK